MIDVFTPKSIFPGCPFKSNQRQAKISILLYSVQFVSTAWCTLGRLSPRSDTHLRDCLCSEMHNVEIVSAAWCTLGRLSPRSDTHLIEIVSAVLCTPRRLLRYDVLDFWEIWNNWLRGVHHIAEIDLAVRCTPRRLSPQRDVHHRDFTWRSFLKIWISQRKQKIIQKFFSTHYTWVQIMKKRGEKISWHSPFNLQYTKDSECS